MRKPGTAVHVFVFETTQSVVRHGTECVKRGVQHALSGSDIFSKKFQTDSLAHIVT